MRRLLTGAAIGFATFLIGLVPMFYPFEGLFRLYGGGLSDCVAGLEPLPTRLSGSSEFTDRLAVYDAIIEDESHGRRYLALLDHTVVPVWFSGVDTSGSLADGLEAESRAYELANEASLDLRFFMRADTRVHFLTDRENEINYWAKREWVDFDKQFPNARGLLSFSAIGFNTSRTQALVNVEIRCGPQCGDDKFDFLIKKNGRWVVRTKYIQWNNKPPHTNQFIFNID